LIRLSITYRSWKKIEKAQSLRKLARLGFEYYVAKNYREDRITLWNTSDLLNLTLSEFGPSFIDGSQGKHSG
jgi:hypothetical protein